MDANNNVSAVALEARENLNRKFMRKGLTLAVVSGMCYALYSAFIMLAQSKGVWADWYGDNTAGLSTFTVVYILGVLGIGINDSISAVWAAIMVGAKGKWGDLVRCVKTRPGAMYMVAAIFGGMAGACYIISMQMAGSMIIPITTLYPSIGAIMARIIYKQKLTARMCFGIALCITASLMIASVSVGDDAKEGMLLGVLIAVFAAFLWALEGVITGYMATIVDYEIGIVIRQASSGIINLGIFMTIFCVIAGQENLYGMLLSGALTSLPAMKIFIISGFFALFAYSLWYKGNNMCGAALGMAANGLYSFWGPLFCWIILGIILGQPGWELPPIIWAGAVVMAIGVIFIAVNPFALFTKGGKKNAAA